VAETQAPTPASPAVQLPPGKAGTASVTSTTARPRKIVRVRPPVRHRVSQRQPHPYARKVKKSRRLCRLGYPA